MFNNLPEGLTELKNTQLFFYLLVYYKGYNAGTTKWKGLLVQGTGGEVYRASMPSLCEPFSLLSTLMCLPTWKLSGEFHCSGVVIELNFQPHFIS